MAYKVFENFGSGNQTSNHSDVVKITAQGSETINLPDASFVKNANISREGNDLILETSGGTLIIEDYFAAMPAPDLLGPEGSHLTPQLVNAFIKAPMQYADAQMQLNDESPVGAVKETSGQATVTRLDGTVETITIGTPIYQGDIIETNQAGAVNIMFIDETTFAVSEDARLAIDEYVFDPATQSGTTNFSVLKGVFVFTSGLIGREDPDDVTINTPSGSIGIRGTIIAGNVNTGEITVIEGAIVLRDFNGNNVTLANQFETARFNANDKTIENIGQITANDVTTRFVNISSVSPELFSSIEETANDDQEIETQRPEIQSEEQNTESSDDTGTQVQEETEEGSITAEDPAQTEETVQTQTTEMTTEEIITSEEIVESEFKEPLLSTTQTNQTTETTTQAQTQTTETPLTTEQPPLQTEEQLAPPPPAPQAVTLTNLMPQGFFSGSQNSTFQHDFSKEFFDPDNTITGYIFSGFASPEIEVGSLATNNINGSVSFALDGAIATNSSFNISVTALSATGNVTRNFNFDVFTPSTTTPTLLTDGEIYSGADTSITIAANNVRIYADTNNVANTILVGGSGTIIKSGGGNDTFQVNDNPFQIYAGTGFDQFNYQPAGNINLTPSGGNVLHDIEHLNFDNGQANNITLLYTDIIRMTDGNNRLEINLDAGDTLNITTNPDQTFTTLAQQNIGGENYDVFTDGIITLLVDADQGTFAGL